MMFINGKWVDIHVALAEGWFKVLGMAVVTGTIKYIADTKKFPILELIFYLSLLLLYLYIDATLSNIVYFSGVFPEKYKKFEKRFNIFFKTFLTFIVTLLLYLVIVNVI